MPVQTAIWKVSDKPEPLPTGLLESERLLEEMIVADLRVLSDEWMLIGRQEDTGFGGRIDLLAIGPDGGLVLIEIKRDRTPREVVAQALDYASWVETLEAGDVAGIYERLWPGRSLSEDFRARFSADLDDEMLNQSHQIVIVAGSLDDSTERIVRYLGDRDIGVNVMCFQVFEHGSDQLLSRTWLLDPARVETVGAETGRGAKEPWNGEFYGSFGPVEHRSWADAVEYGFFSGGGGSFSRRTLPLLASGDRIWVNAPGFGYVGVGRVLGRAQPAVRFMVKTERGEAPVLEVVKGAGYNRDHADDLERCEYFVPVRWLDVVPLERGYKEVGLFGNQNTVCRPKTPKWRSTVERLKARFPLFDAG